MCRFTDFGARILKNVMYAATNPYMAHYHEAKLKNSFQISKFHFVSPVKRNQRRGRRCEHRSAKKRQDQIAVGDQIEDSYALHFARMALSQMSLLLVAQGRVDADQPAQVGQASPRAATRSIPYA